MIKIIARELIKIISRYHTRLNYIFIIKLERTFFCLFLILLNNKILKKIFYTGSTTSNIYNYFISPKLKTINKFFIESFILKIALNNFKNDCDKLNFQLIIFIYLHPYEFDKKLSKFISIMNNPALVNTYIKYIFSNDIFYISIKEQDLHVDFASAALKKLSIFLEKSDIKSQRRILLLFANSAQLNIPLVNNTDLKCYMKNRSYLLNKYVKVIYPNLRFLKQNSFDKPKKIKIRVGIIRFISDFSNSESRQVYEGLVNPPNNIDVLLFSFDIKQNTNTLLKFIPQLKGKIISLPPDNLAESLKIIRSYNLHFMINTSPLSGRFLNEISILLMCRVAYYQLTLISDVITSGIKEVDYFVISKVIKSNKMQGQFVEKLMILNDTPGQQWLANVKKVKHFSGSFDNKKVIFFVSNAHLFKLSPNLINIWAKILQRIPGSKVILMPFSNSYMFQYRFGLSKIIIDASKKNQIDHNRFIIKKTLGSNNVCSEMSKCDIYLDSFPYSSSISLHDALSVRIPIVSLCGEIFRNRMSLSILKKLGLHKEMTVISVNEYISLAEKFALDFSFRKLISKKIDISIKNNSKMFKPNSLNLYNKLIKISK